MTALKIPTHQLSRFQSLIALFILCLVLSILSDRFLTTANAWNVMRQVSVNICLSVGMTLVILTAGIDLSVGLTFDCHKGHVVRAALESIPYQIKDVITAMEQDSGLDLERLMVDGGISNNAFVTQFLADLLQKQVSRMANADVSALGAAYLAGLQAGIFPNLEVLQGFQERTNILPVNNAAVAASYRAWQELIAQKHGV
jgi:ribose/xylose/arabinose/galactoside ABC-type transport system permease subunit